MNACAKWQWGNFMKRRILLTATAAFTAGLSCLFVGGASVRAEPVTDRILSHYQIAQRKGCSILRINFNIRLRYVSHFPVSSGNQLNIMIRPIDPQIAAAESITARESLRPPASNAAALQSIVYEANTSQGSILSVQFTRPVAFDVAPSSDFQSLIIAVARDKRRLCAPSESPFRNPDWTTTVQHKDRETVASRRKVATSNETVIARRKTTKRPGAAARKAETAPDASAGWGTETRDATSSGIRAARAAMRRRDMSGAIEILKGIDGPEALELLGVAYQKDKQPEEARAVYEDYLQRYGTGQGAEGVRQRLAALETAEAAPAEKLRGSRGEGEPAHNRRYWSVSGSASEFYIRDDSFEVVRDPTQPLNLNADIDDHRVHRNVLMSGVDVFATWGDNNSKSKFRFSGTEEHSFDDGGSEIVSVASLYYDTAIKSWNAMARLGRQTRSNDGVLGRFDGAYASWQAAPWLRVGAVGGSPVASRKDEPFKDDRYFYGASVNISQFLGGFDTSIFAIEQRDRDVIDRQAIGAEMRYADPTKSAFLTVDYDTHFSELNAAIFNGSLTFPDKSRVRVAADYRKAPYLNTWTAIQGQQVKTLYELLEEKTQDEVRQMALDRTATYKSASVGYTRQLSEKLQANLDFTVAHIDGTIASYGVDAMPSTGNEYYYSAQLIGNNLLTEDDLWTAALRHSDLANSYYYTVDLSTRYAVTKDWRISPRFVLTYQKGKITDLEEYSILPMLLMDYVWMKDLNFELEVGTRMTWRDEASVETRDAEVFITAGVRYDFYAGSDQLK